MDPSAGFMRLYLAILRYRATLYVRLPLAVVPHKPRPESLYFYARDAGGDREVRPPNGDPDKGK